MPKINVYLSDELAAAVRDAQVPVSAICQSALERAVRDVSAMRGTDAPPAEPANGPFTRFTPRARTAIAKAQQQAIDHRHDYVGTEHVLLGILDEGMNLGVKVLSALDIEPGDLRAELDASMAPGQDVVSGHPPFTPLSKKVLETTANEALSLGHNYIGCEHILLGLIAVEEGLASQVLRRMGIELRTTRRAVITALTGFVHAQAKEAKTPSSSSLEDIVRRLEAIEKKIS
jgi:ATP-dependent Clp protease ATP-binding subunit ClpC